MCPSRRKIPNVKGRKKIDFRIKLRKNIDKDTWIELKHCLMGQKGIRFTVAGHFSNPNGIRRDVEKLLKVDGKKILTRNYYSKTLRE